MKIQLQRLMEAREGEIGVIPRPSTWSNIEVAISQTFNGSSEKMARFVMVCKLYLRMRMREAMVEEQVQWILTYVQRGLGDV